MTDFSSERGLRVAIAMLLIVLGCPNVHAQLVPEEPPGARIHALGYAGVADDSDPANVYNNPANAAFVDRIYLLGYGQGLDYRSYDEADNSGGALTGGYGFDTEFAIVSVGGQLRYSRVTYGEVVATNSQGTPIGTFDPKESLFSFALGCGVEWKHGFFVGLGAATKRLAADYIPAEFTFDGDAIETDTWASDLGLRAGYRTHRERGWNVEAALGGALTNLGGEWSFYEGGLVYEFDKTSAGVSIALDSPPARVFGEEHPLFSMLLNADFVDPTGEFSANFVGMGLELSTLRIFYARVGYVNFDGAAKSLLNLGFGLGVTTSILMVRFDYARDPLEVLDTSVDVEGDNKFSVTVGVF